VKLPQLDDALLSPAVGAIIAKQKARLGGLLKDIGRNLENKPVSMTETSKSAFEFIDTMEAELASQGHTRKRDPHPLRSATTDDIETALRTFVEAIDAGTHQKLLSDEVTGKDRYPKLTKEFIRSITDKDTK
jgi:hypothetical protein